jgi:dipeptidase E
VSRRLLLASRGIPGLAERLQARGVAIRFTSSPRRGAPGSVRPLAALAAGAVYVGYSAGAIVAGPTLEPVRLTAPFALPPELELVGLGLADVLVLPHDNRRGRTERNAAACAAFGDEIRIVRLRDGEFVIQDGDRVDLHRSDRHDI